MVPGLGVSLHPYQSRRRGNSWKKNGPAGVVEIDKFITKPKRVQDRVSSSCLFEFLLSFHQVVVVLMRLNKFLNKSHR